MRGKYSPTVSASYSSDQKWFVKNGGGFGNGKNPDSDLDNDGYDSYGYSQEDGCGPDRAGYTEDNYILDENLFDEISQHWINRKIIL
jgi:hypothetical protein